MTSCADVYTDEATKLILLGSPADAVSNLTHAMALRHNDPVLYFIQRLRDEAHRFAIGTHRAKRAKSQMANPLDEVPGVGASRKRALLAHFGSAKAVSRANLADLRAVDGVSAALAERIYAFFHEQG